VKQNRIARTNLEKAFKTQRDLLEGRIESNFSQCWTQANKCDQSCDRAQAPKNCRFADKPSTIDEVPAVGEVPKVDDPKKPQQKIDMAAGMELSICPWALDEQGMPTRAPDPLPVVDYCYKKVGQGCPKGYVGCAAGCADSDETCGFTTGDQVVSAVSLVANVFSFGVANVDVAGQGCRAAPVKAAKIEAFRPEELPLLKPLDFDAAGEKGVRSPEPDVKLKAVWQELQGRPVQELGR
jgi:hypothetical protein